MDAGEPPRIVLESLQPCLDADRASASLRSALGTAHAPGKAWVLRMRIEQRAGRTLRAEGDIVDDTGVTIAHREISGRAGECSALARAVGIWGSLVFDAEQARAQASAEHAAAENADEAAAGPFPELPPWPAPAASASPAPQEKAPLEPEQPEHVALSHREESRTLELGLGGFLMTGMGGSALVGATPYVVVDVGHGLFLRPALAFGWSAPVAAFVDVHETWAAARFDACLRLSGLYTQHRGMQLDTCGGADLGFTHMGAAAPGDKTVGVAENAITIPYLAVGPSLALRGELGGDLAATLRLLGGINVIQEGFQDASGARVDPSIFSARMELAMSWTLR